VPPGHKVATRAIAAGEPVRRYNQIIGFASKAIAAGEHVHVNNLVMGDFERDKEDWGLIPLNKQFPNLKVCVLEIAPNDFWNEFDLLKKVWSKWLTEMGIDRNNIYFSKSENTEVTTSLVKKVLR